MSAIIAKLNESDLALLLILLIIVAGLTVCSVFRSLSDCFARRAEARWCDEEEEPSGSEEETVR